LAVSQGLDHGQNLFVVNVTAAMTQFVAINGVGQLPRFRGQIDMAVGELSAFPKVGTCRLAGTASIYK